MPDAGTIRKQVEARVAELEATLAPLEAEYSQLKSVVESLAGTRPAKASVRPAARPPRPARRPRPAGGETRAEQAVRLIAARPGATAGDLAKAIGISRNYLYRVLPKLERDGVLRKQGDGYQLAAAGE